MTTNNFEEGGYQGYPISGYYDDIFKVANESNTMGTKKEELEKFISLYCYQCKQYDALRTYNMQVRANGTDIIVLTCGHGLHVSCYTGFHTKEIKCSICFSPPENPEYSDTKIDKKNSKSMNYYLQKDPKECEDLQKQTNLEVELDMEIEHKKTQRREKYEFNKNLLSLGIFKRKALTNIAGNISPIKVMNHEINYAFLISSNITIDDLLDNNIHLECMYKTIGVDSFSKLIDLGFEKKHLFILDKDSNDTDNVVYSTIGYLIPLKSLCSLYSLNFKMLNTDLKLTMKDLTRFQLSKEFLIDILELNADMIFNTYKANKEFLFTNQDTIDLHGWIWNLGFTKDIYKKLGLTKEDLKELGWKNPEKAFLL